MRTKQDWSVVILIVSVQLVLMLVGVMCLFSWILVHTEDSVCSQACQDNLVIGQHIAHRAKSLSQDNQAGENNPENVAINRDNIRPIIGEVWMPNNGFVCLIDRDSSKVIASSAQHQELIGQKLGGVQLRSMSGRNKSDMGTLIDSIGYEGEGKFKAIRGRAHIAGSEHFVSADYFASDNSILLVGQQRNTSVGSVIKTIVLVRRTFFVLTLLVGFAAIGMSLSTVDRMSAKVENSNKQWAKEVSCRQRELEQTQNAIIFGLAKLAESRDNDTGEHLDRIRSYVIILTEELAMRIPEIDEEFMHHLALASSLHDIGKVGIPDAILLKPGRLTAEEREIMELHTLIGGDCLEAIQGRLKDSVFMHRAKQIAYYHHERWDGKGYPHGLSEEEIPLVARIVAVADVYDALTSKRPYKDPMTHLESKAIIVSGSGTQFDPEVVDAFLRHEDKFEQISRRQRELTDDEVRSEFHDLCERAANPPSFDANTNLA